MISRLVIGLVSGSEANGNGMSMYVDIIFSEVRFVFEFPG
jgi:hypothetical protein